jgi:hypothetical protein
VQVGSLVNFALMYLLAPVAATSGAASGGLIASLFSEKVLISWGAPGASLLCVCVCMCMCARARACVWGGRDVYEVFRIALQPQCAGQRAAADEQGHGPFSCFPPMRPPLRPPVRRRPHVPALTLTLNLNPYPNPSPNPKPKP